MFDSFSIPLSALYYHDYVFKLLILFFIGPHVKTMSADDYHLGWLGGSSDIILTGDLSRAITPTFGPNGHVGSKDRILNDFFFCWLFYFVQLCPSRFAGRVVAHNSERGTTQGPYIWSKWNGRVVSEEKKCKKLTMDRWQTDKGCPVVAIPHMTLPVRWVNNGIKNSN